MRARTTRQRGATLIELLTSATITLLVMAGAVAVLFSGSTSWARGIGKIGAESDAQMSIRVVSQQLREAMAVTVDPDGTGLTYRVPQMDAAGDYLFPITWDGVKRRIVLKRDQLQLIDGSSTRILARGVVKTDALNNNVPYRIFTAGPGAITRQVTIEIAVKKAAERAKTVVSRSRETVFLRNIPEMGN